MNSDYNIIQLIPCATELWAQYSTDDAGLGRDTPLQHRMESRVLCLALIEEKFSPNGKTYQRIVGVSFAGNEIYLVEEDSNFLAYSEESIKPR